MNFNNLPRFNHRDDHSSFGAVGEKLENYKSFIQQHIINKEKTPWNTRINVQVLGSQVLYKKPMLVHILQLPRRV